MGRGAELRGPEQAIMMEMRATQQSGQAPMAMTEKRTAPTIGDCVEHSVRRYLVDMGSHQPHDLMDKVLVEVERPLLREVMRWTGGNQSQAASILGISRGTLRRKLARYDML